MFRKSVVLVHLGRFYKNMKGYTETLKEIILKHLYAFLYKQHFYK